MDEPVTSVINLAREEAFALGDVLVRPASLEVSAGEVRRQLEPRVMQVLVALARRRGEVLTRDELIQTCWASRIVSDDAIGRCMYSLRHLGDELGGFRIETVPRVGYRLESTAPPNPRSPPVLLAVLAFDNLSDD